MSTLSSASMPHLLFRQGPRALFVHRLRSGRTVLGRSDRCDVALPAEGISRVHCWIDRREDGWWLVDRSRHGTKVNGERVTRCRLSLGDQLDLGVYTAIFGADAEAGDATTAAAPSAPALHEELVEVSPGTVATSRARLHFHRGPLEGRTVILRQVRTTMGGAGADVVLDAGMPEVGARIRVVRGRAMVEPGQAAVLLAGQRVRELTPVVAGEEIRMGAHVFVVEIETDEERVEATSFGAMVGRSPVMRRLFGVLQRMAGHDESCLLLGESGTGKELAARGLHDLGVRRGGAFVAVNCAAIAPSLFEAELFGHEKGAFTGAAHRQDGAFQRAAGGTLFLDEVGELDLEQQAKLLRVLESGEVRRVGGQAPEYPDVRVVAATNRSISAMVDRGAFREDLYFRLAVLTVRLPPLRERRGDLPLLARTLLERLHPGVRLGDDAVAVLEQHPWPGNVRELRNVLTRAFVLGGPTITASSLSFHALAFDGENPLEALEPDAEPERKQILAALHRANGNRTHAARELRIPRSSLLYKMRKYDIR